jgi:protease-4
VGVISVEGEIFDTRWATDTLKSFEKNKFIRAVVLRIDSPGGAVAPCQELYEAIKKFPKPVVVSMGSVAASGGLYLAVAGNSIFANRGTITGSIGVIMESIEFDQAMDKLGIKSQVIKSGLYKDVGSPFRSMRPDERELLQSMVMNVYEQFVKDVTAGRPKLNEAQVRKMADGRVFTGEEAGKLGLIDEIGGYEKAVEKAMALGKISDPNKASIIYEDGRLGFLTSLLSGNLAFLKPVKSAVAPGLTIKFIYRPGW